MDVIKMRCDLLRLAALYVAHHVPRRLRASDLRADDGDLVHPLLGAIFAKVARASLVGGDDGLGRKGLGYGDEGDVGGIPPGS
jgi:hypothetical protein